MDGHTLVARTYNPGAPGLPILLLHGVMSSLPFWEPQLVEPFLPYGPCTAITLPGHFPAAFPPHFGPSDLTAGCIAALLHAAFQTHSRQQGMADNRPALIVGHSTGGFAALALAVYCPQAVAGVISIAGFAQGRWSGWLRLFQWLARRERLGRAAFSALLFLGSLRPLFRASAAYHTPIPRGRRTPRELEDLIEANFQAFRGFDARAMQIYFAAMSDINILPQLPAIRVPVLALCGDADPAVPPVQSERIAAAIPRAELVVLRGGVGHMPFYAAEAAYRAAVDGWLRKHFAQ